MNTMLASPPPPSPLARWFGNAGMLLLIECLVGALFVVQVLPAYLIGVWNTEATFEVLEDARSQPRPIEATFDESAALQRISCTTDAPIGGRDTLRCRMLGDGTLFDAQDYLHAQGIRTSHHYRNVSAWPSWGALSLALWQLALAALLLWLWRRWSRVDLGADLSALAVTLRDRPALLLAPFAASATAASLALAAVPYSMPTLNLPSGLLATEPGIAAALTAVAVAPLLEELLFRGLVYDALGRRMTWGWAAVFGSLSFAGMHSLLLMQGANGGVQLIGIFAAGVALCWLRRTTGSLSVCVLAHALVNAIVLATQYRQSLGT